VKTYLTDPHLDVKESKQSKVQADGFQRSVSLLRHVIRSGARQRACAGNNNMVRLDDDDDGTPSAFSEVEAAQVWDVVPRGVHCTVPAMTVMFPLVQRGIVDIFGCISSATGSSCV